MSERQLNTTSVNSSGAGTRSLGGGGKEPTHEMKSTSTLAVAIGVGLGLAVTAVASFIGSKLFAENEAPVEASKRDDGPELSTEPKKLTAQEQFEILRRGRTP